MEGSSKAKYILHSTDNVSSELMYRNVEHEWLKCYANPLTGLFGGVGALSGFQKKYTASDTFIPKIHRHQNIYYAPDCVSECQSYRKIAACTQSSHLRLPGGQTHSTVSFCHTRLETYIASQVQHMILSRFVKSCFQQETFCSKSFFPGHAYF